DLVVAERARGDDFGGRLAAVLGGEAAEGADHGAKRVLAAVAGEYAEKVRGNRVEPELRRERGERLAGLFARYQRARDQLGEILRIEQGLTERIEAAADGFDLPLVTGKVKQSRRVAPC